MVSPPTGGLPVLLESCGIPMQDRDFEETAVFLVDSHIRSTAIPIEGIGTSPH